MNRFTCFVNGRMEGWKERKDSFHVSRFTFHFQSVKSFSMKFEICCIEYEMPKIAFKR